MGPAAPALAGPCSAPVAPTNRVDSVCGFRASADGDWAFLSWHPQVHLICFSETSYRYHSEAETARTDTLDDAMAGRPTRADERRRRSCPGVREPSSRPLVRLRLPPSRGRAPPRGPYRVRSGGYARKARQEARRHQRPEERERPRDHTGKFGNPSDGSMSGKKPLTKTA
jgi:hypothetical protein